MKTSPHLMMDTASKNSDKSPFAHSSPPRRGGSGWLVGLLLLGVLGGAGWVAYRVLVPAPVAVSEVAKLAPVEQLTLPLTVSASGTIQPERVVNVSPKRAGILSEILVEEGDPVQAGQLIAIMDSSDLLGRRTQAMAQLAAAQANLARLQAGSRPQEIAQAQARLTDAQAALRQASDQLERDKSLQTDGAISIQQLVITQSNYDRALASVEQMEQALQLLQVGSRAEDIAQAQAEVLAAEGAIQSMETELADTRILAPFAGVVTRKFSEPGAFVAPTSVQVDSGSSAKVSAAIVSIAGTNQVIANVAETDISQIRIGQTASLRADAYDDQEFTAEVSQIAPQAVLQQNVTSFEVKMAIRDDAEGLLRPGMNVDIEFQVGSLENALVVPTVAILRQEDQIGVFVNDAEGNPIFNPLEIGVSIGDKTEVKSGLTGDEQVYITFPEGYKPSARGLFPTLN
ncbi:MAG: efflux RND transporter periplasmic adaptor subunit [Cyanobacteriota bacterium]|nr:efflux RND transporter periplasmic adaptor subunit [Cyanobacteriota bacterium]